VTDLRNLRIAFARVQRNRGVRTAGIYRVTVRQVLQSGVMPFLDEIYPRLSPGSKGAAWMKRRWSQPWRRWSNERSEPERIRGSCLSSSKHWKGRLATHVARINSLQGPRWPSDAGGPIPARNGSGEQRGATHPASTAHEATPRWRGAETIRRRPGHHHRCGSGSSRWPSHAPAATSAQRQCQATPLSGRSTFTNTEFCIAGARTRPGERAPDRATTRRCAKASRSASSPR
jgi:hypothetical protein